MSNAGDNRPNPRPRRGGLRLAIPLLLIALSLWLLIGCIYLPTKEKVRLTGTTKDFRSLPGYAAGGEPQVAGRFTRERIEALLGRPPYVSDTRRSVMYVLHIKTGIFLAPLCFTARDWNDDCVGLVLTYDPSGRLLRWRRVAFRWPGMLALQRYSFFRSGGWRDRLAA
jgi:hypothetical protein